MTTHQKIWAGFFLLTLVGCSTGYENNGKAVYYKHWNEASGRHKEKIDANPATFKIFGFDKYAKDDKNVFYKGEIITGADAESFEALEEFYARDKNIGYYGKAPIKNSIGKTFKVINSYYSTDGKDYFYDTSALNMADPNNFKFVYGEGDYQCWTTDGKYYYYNNYKVPSDDYANLTIYEKSGGISKDRHWDYLYRAPCPAGSEMLFRFANLNPGKYNVTVFMGRTSDGDGQFGKIWVDDINGKKVVDTIDILSFKVTGYLECEDKYGCFNVYWGRKKCTE